MKREIKSNYFFVKLLDMGYDDPVSLCLYDLWELVKECPERWMYKLGNIYDKYGVDIVNLVRDAAQI